MLSNSDESLKENLDPLSKGNSVDLEGHENGEGIDSEGPLKRAKLSEGRERAEPASEGLGSLESKEERTKRKQAEEMLWELCPDCDAHLVRVTRKPGRGRRRKLSPDEEAALKAIPSVIHLHGKGPASSRITIGRQSNLVDVVIEPVVKGVSEYIISRKHAVVEKKRVDEDGDFLWIIEDTNSLNGVFVNNVKRKKCVLKDDDTIIFGGGGSLKEGEKFVQNDSKFIYKFKLMKSVKASTGATELVASPKRAKAKRRRKAVSKLSEESISDKSLDKPSGKFEDQVSSIVKEMQKQRAALLTLEKAVGGLASVREAEQAQGKGLSAPDERAVSLFGAELYCSLCNDLFVDPAVVPCGHSFCRACILERIVSGNDKCPACLAAIRGKSDIYPALTVSSCVRVCLGLLPDGEKTLYETRAKTYDAKVRELLETCAEHSPEEQVQKANNSNDSENDVEMLERLSQKTHTPKPVPPVSPSQQDKARKKSQQQSQQSQQSQQPKPQPLQQSQKSENSQASQKSPRKSKMPRSSQASQPSPKVSAKKKKKPSPMKPKKQQDQQQQQQQPQVDDTVRAQKLRAAIEKAKKRGTKFLDITEPWEDDDKETFIKGLSNYSSPLLRTIYCEMIGLTQEWVETTGVKDMLTAVNNLSLNCDASNIQELRKVLNDYISCGGQHKISSFFKAI